MQGTSKSENLAYPLLPNIENDDLLLDLFLRGIKSSSDSWKENADDRRCNGNDWSILPIAPLLLPLTETIRDDLL